jgi:integrase
MASGCIVTYRGKRGTVYRMKYVDASGRQVMETLPGVETKTEAKERLQNRLAEVNKGFQKREGKVPTFGTYKLEWFETESNERSWRVNSQEAKLGSLNRLARYFDHLRLDKIRVKHVKEFKTAAREHYSASTISNDIGVLVDVLNCAVEDETIEVNYVARVRRPKVVERKWRTLRPDEIVPVLHAFEDEQARTMFLTLVETGLRKGELCNLKWGDVHLADPSGPYLYVRESKSEAGVRSLALSPPLAEALAQRLEATAYRGEGERVYCHPERGTSLYDHPWYAKAFRAACVKAGITDYIRPYHDMRHTAITNLVADAPNVAILGTLAGHADMKTTQRYIHLTGTMYPELAASLSERYGLAVKSEDEG